MTPQVWPGIKTIKVRDFCVFDKNFILEDLLRGREHSPLRITTGCLKWNWMLLTGALWRVCQRCSQKALLALPQNEWRTALSWSDLTLWLLEAMLGKCHHTVGGRSVLSGTGLSPQHSLQYNWISEVNKPATELTTLSIMAVHSPLLLIFAQHTPKFSPNLRLLRSSNKIES